MVLYGRFSYPTDEHFDVTFGNPPFGKIKTSDSYKGEYTGSEFEYKVIEFGSLLADYGVSIMPQGSAGFRYSGAAYYERVTNQKYYKFEKDTGLYLEAGCGVDTSIYRDQWHSTNVLTEVVAPCLEKVGIMVPDVDAVVRSMLMILN